MIIIYAILIIYYEYMYYNIKWYVVYLYVNTPMSAISDL